MRPKKGVALADLHVGSAFAMWPFGFRTSTHNIPEPNQAQTYLAKCWDHFLSQIPKRLDFVLLEGDIIEGQMPKDEARYLTEVDPGWQARAAELILAPLLKRTKTIIYHGGTAYHAGIAAKDEEVLARSLGALPNAAGHHARTWDLLTINGAILDCAHAQSVMMRYKTTSIAREVQFAQMLAAKENRRPPDMIIRAHAHQWIYANIDGTIGVTLPPWKLSDAYCERSRIPNRMRSRILGALEIRIAPTPDDPLDAEAYITTRLHAYRQPIKVPEAILS